MGTESIFLEALFWRDIYSVIGLRQGLSTEALRFAATLNVTETPHRPLGERDAVAELRGATGTARKIRAVAAWLLRVTEACEAVISNPRLNAVTRISQARLLATAIHLREDITPKAAPATPQPLGEDLFQNLWPIEERRTDPRG